MSGQSELLAQLQQREKELQEQLKTLQAQAHTLEQNSPERENATAEIPKIETELKETQSKIEEVKEHYIESKIETVIEGAELTAKAADHYFLHMGAIEPTSAGLAAQAAAQAAEIVRNPEATEAYIKGTVNEKIEAVKEFIAENFPEKDVAKEWEKDIEGKEKAINDKFDKEIKETEKSFQKQSDYIEKNYSGQEKDDKMNALKEMEKNVTADIEKDRTTELKQQEERKDNLEQIKESTKDMEAKEMQRQIERQRELEWQRDIDRQRQIEEQNRRK